MQDGTLRRKEEALALFRNEVRREVSSPSSFERPDMSDRLARLYPHYQDKMRQIPLPYSSILKIKPNEPFLRALYFHLLMRHPDPEGYRHHLERLTSGAVVREKLFQEFQASDEAREIRQAGQRGGVLSLLRQLAAYFYRRLVRILGRFRSTGAESR